MAKTINDYKADYAAARAAGDAAGMKAANDGANALRAAQGQAAEYATADIAKVAAGSSTKKSSTTQNNPPSGGYTQKYTGGNAALDAGLAKYGQAYQEARTKGDPVGMREANDSANQLRNQYGYAAESANDDIQTIAEQTGYYRTEPPQQAQPSARPVQNQSTAQMQALLSQWQQQAQSQSDAKIDYNVEKSIADLQRALEDAQVQFKEQQEQVSRDEMQARDNSALYSEMRGDKGGIGAEQYNSIMNTAAQNRLTVSQAQTKLATDTQRQIADLRAQGEFEKADAALEIAQTYLSQLISLEQWAASYNLSAEQFNESVRQWEAEFQHAMTEYKDSLDISRAQLTGKFADGTTTLDAQQQVRAQLVSSGEALLAYGVMPSPEQLEAMNMTSAQAKQAIQVVQLERAAQLEKLRNTSSGGDDEPQGGVLSLSLDELYQHLYDLGYTKKDEASAKAYLISQGMGSTDAGTYANAYATNQYSKLKDAAEGEHPVEGGPPVEGDSLEYNGRTYQRLYNQILTGGWQIATVAEKIEKADLNDTQKDRLLTMIGY